MSLKRIRYAFETIAVYAVYGFFWALPLDAASACGSFILRCLGPHLRLTQVARRNLQQAFPEKSQKEIETIITGMWDNLGRVAAEYPHLSKIWKNVELVGAEHLISVRDSGRPAIFFGGHLANWEINAQAAKKNGLNIHLVYRKPNNPWVDGLLRHARNAGAAGHIRKGAQGARDILAVIRDNGAVGILVDQRLNEGMAIPFFGRDAMTPTVVAPFALKYACPLYPSRVERVSGTYFRVTIYPPLLIQNTGHRENDERRILTEINALLESWVRERPEQWLWIHRRWPEGSRK